MPVTSVPGLAGVIDVSGQRQANPLQDFVESVTKAQQVQRSEAMDKLQWMASMVTKSGGRFLPDPKEAEKLAKAAGLPKMLTQQGGGDMFAGMGQAAQQAEHLNTEQMQSAIAANQAATAQSGAQTARINQQNDQDKMDAELQAKAADPSLPQETRADATKALMIRGKMTRDMAVFTSASPEQQTAMWDAAVAKETGDLTPAEKERYVMEQVAKNKDDFGTPEQARQYYQAVVNHQQPPPESMPAVSPKKIMDAIAVWSAAAEANLTPELTNELFAAGGDVSKVPNWPKDIKTVAMQRLDIERQNLDLGRRQAAVQERQAAVAERGVAVAERQEESETALRFSQAWKALQAGGTDVADILKGFEAVRTAKLAGRPVDKAISAHLEELLAGQFGMQKVEAHGIIGRWIGSGYTFEAGGGAADPNAAVTPVSQTTNDKGTGLGVSNIGGAGLVSPETLRELPGQTAATIRQIPGFSEEATKKAEIAAANAIVGAKDEVARGLDASKEATRIFNSQIQSYVDRLISGAKAKTSPLTPKK